MRFLVPILSLFLAATAPAANESRAQEFLRSLTSTIGPCACSTDALSREAGDRPLGKASLKDFNGESFPVSVLNDEFVLKIFQELTVQKKIPFGFPEDGCYARAHEMSYQLEQQGIETGKVFATGDFHLQSGKAAKGQVRWSFHVAPVLIVDNGKSRAIWVLDPSLFSVPTPLTAWLEKLTSHPRAKLKDVYLTNKYIYHPKLRGRKLKNFDPDQLQGARQLMRRYLKKQSKRELEKTPDL